jgi:hypothetical protein
MKFNLVKFKDGAFGVMKKDTWLSREEFLGVGNYEWWAMPCMIVKYCKFKTQEEAEAAIRYIDISYTVIK